MLYTALSPRRILLSAVALCFCLALAVSLTFYSLDTAKQQELTALQYHAESLEELNSLKEAGKPTVLFFGADYCPECRSYYDDIALFSALYGDKITIRYINTEQHRPVRPSYNIERIPSTVFFDADGNPWLPPETLKLNRKAYIVNKRAHVSELYTPTLGEALGENPYFKFGLDANGTVCYTKYVGSLSIFQLQKIARLLLK